jgi:hypothetical protein
MEMNVAEKPYDLKERTRAFALRVIRLYASQAKVKRSMSAMDAPEKDLA